MKTIEAWIEGTNALLQHRFSEASQVAVASNTRRATLSVELPRDVAERSAYREPGGALYLPGSSIARLLREAGGAHRQRGTRRSLKYIVPAAVFVLDDAIPLFATDRTARLDDFEIDSRPVTIPATKGRVMRHRPRLDRWSARVGLRINDDVLAAETVRQLLVEGGGQIGLGDYRPERGGPFGTFALVSWTDGAPAKETS